jgi:signal transduction histidine kinase
VSVAIKVKQSSPHDWLVFLPVLISLIIIWAVFVKITMLERKVTLERAQQQLEVITATLVDLNVLAEKAISLESKIKEAQQDALWQALLRYPTAGIWVESKGGIVLGGRPLIGDPHLYITAQTSRENLTAHAALPKADVLSDWYSQCKNRSGILVLISLVFLLLTQLWARASRQLRTAYHRLQRELTSRQAAQEALHEHDLLLKIVTQGASELLGTRSSEEAIASVLTLIGETVKVSWVHLYLKISEPEDKNLQFSLRFEWSASDIEKIINNAKLQHLNLAYQFHQMISPNQVDEPASFYTEELAEPFHQQLKELQMHSFLYIPIILNNELLGSLLFIDASATKRLWSWAETDVLKTLAGLLGVTITQMRYAKELANVGNVLNSVNVSANFITEKINQNRLLGLRKAIDLIHEHKFDLEVFFSKDKRGSELLNYMNHLYEYLLSNHQETLKELNRLLQSIDHINKIVAMQQAYAGVITVMEMIDIINLVEDSLNMTINVTNPLGIKVVREFSNVPLINLDKHKVLQILVNLISNAEHACAGSTNSEKFITVRVFVENDYVKVSIIDNGVGISQENINLIFNYGFTTRITGHGFGLHNSVLAAQEMGGRLYVYSDGIGKGATFTLELPLITLQENVEKR